MISSPTSNLRISLRVGEKKKSSSLPNCGWKLRWQTCIQRINANSQTYSQTKIAWNSIPKPNCGVSGYSSLLFSRSNIPPHNFYSFIVIIVISVSFSFVFGILSFISSHLVFWWLRHCICTVPERSGFSIRWVMSMKPRLSNSCC